MPVATVFGHNVDTPCYYRSGKRYRVCRYESRKNGMHGDSPSAGIILSKIPTRCLQAGMNAVDDHRPMSRSSITEHQCTIE